MTLHYYTFQHLCELEMLYTSQANTERPTNYLKLFRWRLIQQSVQHFWKKWSLEYLHEIQQRGKWFTNRGNPVREGMIVVVCDDNLPPLQWRLARVHHLHPGSDGITRVVTLQIGKTYLKRPVNKICPLPIE
ncbi:unnamed protein product [Parnassius mnemosyne]|uniref:DUF5641 domain-containing protein n=1 Tax=Parnassius mnemosyne TaxID=213953 RepID=A0AAV1LT08_9NEOP